MIYGTLEHIEQYQGITPGVMKGLRFLAETDFSTYAEAATKSIGTCTF